MENIPTYNKYYEMSAEELHQAEISLMRESVALLKAQRAQAIVMSKSPAEIDAITEKLVRMLDNLRRLETGEDDRN